MPIRRFKNALRARMSRAADLKIGPFAPSGVHLTRRYGDVWRATSSDPQLVFPAPPPEVATLVLYVRADNDRALTPRLYFDWGAGFFEDNSVGFAPTRAALIRVDLARCHDLRQLRLDPLEGLAEFAFQWAADADGEALAAAVAPELMALEARRAPTSRESVAAADFAPAGAGPPVRTFAPAEDQRRAFSARLRARNARAAAAARPRRR